MKKSLYRGEVNTSTGTVLYTVPPSTTTEVKSIVVSNNTAASLTFTLKLAGVAFSTTQLVVAYTAVVFDIGQVLAPYETIIGGASANSSVTFHISGIEEV